MLDYHSSDADFSPVLYQAVDYWRLRRDRKGRLPALKDINLMDLYFVAPGIFIADLVEQKNGPPRFRWRYWGAKVTNFVGRDVTGMYLDETHDEDASREALESYTWSLAKGEPHFWRQTVRVRESARSHCTYERVVLPLADAAGVPAHLLGLYASDHETPSPGPGIFGHPKTPLAPNLLTSAN